MRDQLDYLFKPDSVAVIGASDDNENAGCPIFRNLKKEYMGKLFAVNPNRKTVQGEKCFASIKEIGSPVDLAVIATPALSVPGIVAECGQSGVRAIQIVSAGIVDSKGTNSGLLSAVKDSLARYQMRLLGPNCLGFINPVNKINTTFAKMPALPGNIAFVSQSGAFCSSVLDWAWEKKTGFRYFVSIGDMADLTYTELIDYLGEDDSVGSVVLYMESLREGKSFLESAANFVLKKPLFVLKSGASKEGAKTARSHTGRLAGDDEVFEAAFNKAGIVRLKTAEELFDAMQALSMKMTVGGNRLAIVTNGGGPAVIATDMLVKNGGALAKFSEATIKKLKEGLAENISVDNPLDILGDADSLQYQFCVETCLKDENTDAVIAIVTPQTMTDAAKIAVGLVKAKDPQEKMLLACFMGSESVRAGVDALAAKQIRNFNYPEDAVQAFVYLNRYRFNKAMLEKDKDFPSPQFSVEKEKVEELLAGVAKEGRRQLTEVEAKQLLAYYGIPAAEGQTAYDAREAGDLAEKISFPVILKIVSTEILHKTEVGGYRGDILTKTEAEEAYTDIIASVEHKAPDVKIKGVLVEKMYRKKYELLLGLKRDAVFGPVVVFGSGGVAVEVFKDTVCGLPPFSESQAERLINKTKIARLLAGYRGISGVDIDKLKQILCRFSVLVTDFEQIAAIDINPLAADDEGFVVLDAKVLLAENGSSGKK